MIFISVLASSSREVYLIASVYTSVNIPNCGAPRSAIDINQIHEPICRVHSLHRSLIT